MRHFIVSYSSQNNTFKGQLHVKADTLAMAQDKFIEWVQQQPAYLHLWQLSFSFEEIQQSL